MRVVELGAVVGAHVGPGTLAVAVRAPGGAGRGALTDGAVLVVEVAVVAVVCFLIGSINPASLVARALGHDLRSAGSGNPGATNAGRVLGRKWGVLVLVLDVAKAWLPTVLVLRTMGTVPALVAGLAVVLGHVFSPFLRGRGGKGVACALGAVLALEPFVGLGAVVVFALAKTVLPYVGEASVVTMLVVAVVGLAGGCSGSCRSSRRSSGSGWCCCRCSCCRGTGATSSRGGAGASADVCVALRRSAVSARRRWSRSVAHGVGPGPGPGLIQGWAGGVRMLHVVSHR